MKIIVTILLGLWLAASCNADTTTVWRNGGWDVTTSFKAPGTPAGTKIILSATATVYVEDEIYKVYSEPLELTVGAATFKKSYVTNEVFPDNMKVEMDKASGSGGIEFTPEGKLHWWVIAKNNGFTSNFIYRILFKH